MMMMGKKEMKNVISKQDRDWRDGSVLESSCCSARGPNFGSHAGQLTTVCDFNSRKSSILFWLLKTLHTCAHTPTHPHTQHPQMQHTIKNKVNYRKYETFLFCKCVCLGMGMFVLCMCMCLYVLCLCMCMSGRGHVLLWLTEAGQSTACRS